MQTNTKPARGYFISWAPNPDPLYHRVWESPVGMPIDPPLAHVSIPVDGYMLSLDHLIGGRAKKGFKDLAERQGLHKVLRYRGPIMLDSGGYQTRDRHPLDVLDLQARFKPDFAIHMDVLGNVKKTIRYAKLTKQYEDSVDFKIHYVIQGKTVADYIKCARALTHFGCERFALGNLSRLSFLRKVDLIYQVIPAVKRIVGNCDIHLLGVSDPGLISSFRNIITSFDSATGIRNATTLREVFFLSGDTLIYFKKPSRRPPEFRCRCPVCKVFDVFENEYGYPKGTGQRRRVRFLRAVHNTYVWRLAINRSLKRAYVVRI